MNCMIIVITINSNIHKNNMSKYQGLFEYFSVLMTISSLFFNTILQPKKYTLTPALKSINPYSYAYFLALTSNSFPYPQYHHPTL